MAEEILYCPSCNNKLRMPTEMLGEVVQCPLCNLVFTTPSRGAEHPALQGEAQTASTYSAEKQILREQARKLLQVPAIGLQVCGILGLLVFLIDIGSAIFFPEAAIERFRAIQAIFRAFGFPTAQVEGHRIINGQIIGALLFLAVNSFMLLAAVNMLRLRKFRLALSGSIVGMMNFGSCCCLLSFPFGIWALVVLMRPDVKAAFE